VAEWQTRFSTDCIDFHVKYTKEILEPVVKLNLSFAGVLRSLGLKITGGSQANIKRLIVRYGIDFSHFTGKGHTKGKHSNNRRHWSEVLIRKSKDAAREGADVLRRALVESGVNYECAECQLGSRWNGKDLRIQVDHIDGDFLNNKKENLRFLCPNCHSQTETFGKRKT